MNYNDQFKTIIHAMEAQDNETVQHAEQAYFDLITDQPEKFYFAHIDLIISEKETDKIKVLVLLGSFFSILYNKKIPISEESTENILTTLFSLFQIEMNNKQYFDLITNAIFKAARYFQDDWPELPEFLFQLIEIQNPLIVSSATQCLSDCINEGFIDIGPLYENLVTFIKNSLTEPNESISITIFSILRLLYSIVDFINDDDEQNEIFIPIINLIPNYLQMQQKDSIMLNDLFLFARFHQNLFSESFQNYFEVLMKIIDESSYSSSIQNTAIYCLFSIIPNYSKCFQSQSCLFFDFFVNKLNDTETYDASIYSIILLSEMYGGCEQYGHYLYSFFQNNIPNPVAYISFGISYKRIKDHFKNMNISNELLNSFSQGFTSEISSVRLSSFQSFCPLIEIFYQSNKDDFNFLELFVLLLKIIQCEEENDVLTAEIKMLSKLLKLYSSKIHHENISDIVKILDFLIENSEEQTVIIHTIQCYKYIGLSSNDIEFITLSKFFEECINNQQESGDLFFICMKSLPLFKNSFPNDIFINLMERLFQILFEVFDENKIKIKNGEDYECLLIDEKPIITKFFLRCIENDTFFDSSEIIEKIKTIVYDFFEEKPNFEIIPENVDLDLTECCVIIPAPVENKSIIISFEEMSIYRNSLNIIIEIFKRYPDLIQSNYKYLYKLSNDFLKSILKTNLFLYIFDLEILIAPFIQTEDELIKLIDKTLDKEIVHDYDSYELEKLSDLIFVFFKLTVEKWKENTDIIERIVEFSLHVLACLAIENNDKKDDELPINDDQQLFNSKVKYALILRESFRFYQQFSTEFFDELTFNIINEIQTNNDSNKVIAAIIFSDFLHFCEDGNEKYWKIIFELFKSFFESQNLNVKLSSIYGLSIISTPNSLDVDSINSIIGMFLHDIQNNFNVETCSMVAFAFLQIFQNWSSVFDVSIHLKQFWELINGENFEIPKYCYEYITQSLLFFESKYNNSIPEDKVQELCTIIQKIIDKNIYASLDEQLQSILMRFTPNNNNDL